MLLVEDLMTPDPIHVRRNDRVSRAERLMVKHNLRHLPVLAATGMLVGVLSQRDLLARGHGSLRNLEDKTLEHLDDLEVGEVMTAVVHVVQPKQTAVQAGQMLLLNKYGCLPVVDGHRLVGMLTEADFVRYIVENAGVEANPFFQLRT